MVSEECGEGSCPVGPSHGHQSGDARAAKSQFSRDMFPLPVPPEVRREKTLGRRVAQRVARHIQQTTKEREAVKALNWMAGYKEEFENSQFSPDALQSEVIGRVRYLAGLCQDKGELAEIPKPEAALKALLRGRSEYSSDEPTTLAACSLARISLPESLHDAPAVESVLDDEARHYLQSPEHMLKPGCETGLGEFQPYWDPLLRRDAKLYKKFIQKLNQAGYLVFTQNPKSFCGVFFVRKSDGRKIRMIIDARGTNSMFRPPPGVDLLTSDGFSRIELNIPSHFVPGSADYDDYLDRHRISIGLSDVKDCFHRLRQPRWLCDYFCLDGVPASWVGLENTYLDNQWLAPDSIVYPAPGSLPMGFTWALYFAQRASEVLMTKVPSLQKSTLVHDRSSTIVFGEGQSVKNEAGEPRPVHHYVYVDNLGVLSVNHDTVETALREVEDVFGSHKLILHPGLVSSGTTKALGCALRGDLLASRVTSDRYHKLRQAIQGVLERKRVSGRILEVLVGHATFVALMNRHVLSVFNTVYRYINAHYHKPAPLWTTVREELSVFRGLMIFLHADWARPWNTYVTATDSSLEGFGVVSSHWQQHEVASAGRNLERARFRKLGSHSARASALTAAGFVHDEATDQWKAGWLDSPSYLEHTGWALAQEFKEIPGYLLQADRWTPRLWGKWQHSAGILELEARALVKGLKRIAMSTFGHDVRQLLLTDNMSVCLAFDRSRARSFSLLVQIRKFAAYCLARNIYCVVRWVPSELNSADKPSRLHSEEASKDLAHAIPHVRWTPPGSSSQASSGKECQAKAQVQDAGATAAFNCFEGEGVDPCKDWSGRSTDHTAESGHVQPVDGAPGKRESQSRETQQRGEFKCLDQSEQKSCAQSWATTSGSEESKAPSESHGGSPLGRSVASGTASCWRSDLQAVPEGASVLPQLCKAPGIGDDQCQDSGRASRGLHEPDVSGRPSELPSRQVDGCHSPPLPTIWPVGGPEIAAGLASAQGLQTADAGEVPVGLPLSLVGSLCGGAEALRMPEDGSFHAPCCEHLRQAVGAPSGKSVQSGAARARDHEQLVVTAGAGGGGDSHENGGLRCLDPSGQPVVERLEPRVIRLSEAIPPNSTPLGFQLPRVPAHDEANLGHVWCGCDAVSDTALGSLHRPRSAIPQPLGGAEARAVESAQKRGALRKERQAGQHMGVPTRKFQDPRHALRARPWGNSFGAKTSPPFCHNRRPGQYVMDLFSGQGGVGRAVRHFGFNAKFWDIRFGTDHDLTNKGVLQKILREIRQGRVLACMLAPVCASFGRGCDRTKAIRTRAEPWGISANKLTAAERDSILLGNRCFVSCFRIMRELDKFKIPYILENPAYSKAWWLPALQRHQSRPWVRFVQGDFCQFGSSWQKTTTFLCAHIPEDDLRRLACTCQGPPGICSRTLKPHVLLSGNWRGRPRAQWAEIYPNKLSTALAYALTAAHHIPPYS